ncbi:hypothetical protein B0T22DRAFT_456707 [Podospora appendiculata]|uniref:Uncharacterized protein n=1 Tax=Podospora appendiculata TaxID=314037 RepID=A0AAE1CBA2_9PEZI|nr:hypothetical protein B0T22DRAFT_456707 [Podospora appendiculata]
MFVFAAEFAAMLAWPLASLPLNYVAMHSARICYDLPHLWSICFLLIEVSNFIFISGLIRGHLTTRQGQSLSRLTTSTKP